MAGKKEEDVSDLAADFFGDSDMDWLDEDSPGASQSSGGVAGPKAPPPPPPFAANSKGSVVPKTEGEATPPGPTPPPLAPRPDLATQKTLVFSDIPTLPPLDSELVPKGEPGQADTAVPTEDEDERRARLAGLDGSGQSDLVGFDSMAPRPVSPEELAALDGVPRNLPSDFDLPAEEGEDERPIPTPLGLAESGPILRGTMRSLAEGSEDDLPTEERPTEQIEDTEEAVFADDSAGEPLVRTADPTPIRMSLPESLGREPQYTPVIEPRATPPVFSGASVAGDSQAVEALVAEARATTGSARGTLLFHAGWLQRHRLADAAAARSSWTDALELGANPASVHRELMDLELQDENWSAAAEHLRSVARGLEGRPAGETFREAGTLALRRLQDPGAGVRDLRAAIDRTEDDYASLMLIADHLPDSQPERASVLLRLASLSTGQLKAEFAADAASSIVTHRGEGLEAALKVAHESYPRHTPTFMLAEAAAERAGDPTALAELYAREATLGGPSAGWWSRKAAIQYAIAGNTDASAAAFDAASTAGWEDLEPERLGWWLRQGAIAEVSERVARRASVETDSGPWWFWLGALREFDLDDLPGALEAYQHAADAQPDVPVIAAAIERLQARVLDPADRLASAQAAAGTDAAAHVAAGELALSIGQDEVARTSFARALELQPEFPLAAFLSVVADLRAGGRQIAAAHYESLASTVDSPARAAMLLSAAAMCGGDGALEADRLALHGRALDADPGNLPSLHAWVAAGHSGTASRLNAAASGWPGLESTLRYLAARRFDEEGAVEAALEAVDASLAADPANALASAFRTELLGRDRVALANQQIANDEPDRWDRFARAVWSGFQSSTAVGDIFHDELKQVAAVASGDKATQLEQLDRRSSEVVSRGSAQSLLKNAQLRVDTGDVAGAQAALDDLASMDTEDRPIQAASRLARRIEAHDTALRLLAAIPEDWARLERAALASRRRRDLDEASEVVSTLLDEHPDNTGAARVATRIGNVTGRTDLTLAGQAALAVHGGSDAERLANLLWQADLTERAVGPAAAWELYSAVRELAPDSRLAFEGLLRTAMADRDEVKIQSLAEHPFADLLLLAQHLTALESIDFAIELAERAALTEPALPALLLLEQLHASAQNWSAVDGVMERRLAVTVDSDHRARLATSRQALLAEHLPESDAAWEVFGQLHAADPENRGVTETLATIAGRRGETELAIGYLVTLADSAEGPQDKARYKYRIADAHLAAGDTDAARTAYLDAMDLVPDDPTAIAGLKRIARDSEDWPSLVQVLQREAGLSEGDAKVACLRQVAQVTEEHIGEPSLALEAWEAVAQIDGSDREALTRCMALSEGLAEWSRFVDSGNVLAALSTGAERTTLLRRVGIVCREQLRSDDAIRFLERAVTEEPPDMEAARQLEELYRQRNDGKGVIRTLEIQGTVGENVEERAGALKRAAHHSLSDRHDREIAAGFYRRVLEIAPDDEEALRFMAGHLFEAGRFDEALPVCQRLAPMVERGQDLDDFDTRMELAQFHFYFGEMLRLDGQDNESIGRYERALELNPTYVAALEAIGPLYRATEQWQGALKIFRQLLQLSGGQGERHRVAGQYTNLGVVERALGNHDKALKRFNKALEIDPNHVDAMKGLALLNEDRGDWSNMLTQYNEVIFYATVAADITHAYLTKARILDDEMSRPDKAAQHYHRSIDFQPDQPLVLLRLAELAMRKDEHQEAADFAKKGLAVPEVGDDVRRLLHVVVAATLKAGDKGPEAKAELAKAGEVGEGGEFPSDFLDDLEALRQYVKASLPIR